METLETPEELKGVVREYWNRNPCGIEYTQQPKYSREYFDEIENYRYTAEPEIFSFAQFTRFHGKKILEVGVGAGTDFLQFVRAGAKGYGVDFTQSSIDHVKRRLQVYGVNAEEIRVGDCENLTYGNDSFDMVYSWGVIHHTPDTQRALEEIVRVMRPGGIGKIMIYNRHSLYSFFLWCKKALLRGRPWKSFAWCIYHFLESYGTKVFTKKEVLLMLHRLPVENIRIRTIATLADKLDKSNVFFRLFAKIALAILGEYRVGFYMTIQFNKRTV